MGVRGPRAGARGTRGVRGARAGARDPGLGPGAGALAPGLWPEAFGDGGGKMSRAYLKPRLLQPDSRYISGPQATQQKHGLMESAHDKNHEYLPTLPSRH